MPKPVSDTLSYFRRDDAVGWQLRRLLNYVRDYERSRRGFARLLKVAPTEHVLHEFLRRHPALLLTMALGGFFPVNTHRALVLNKLSFGNEHESDFAIVHGDSMGMWWVFVELERSNVPLFTRAGDPSKYLNHAIRQVTDWSTWLRENSSYAKTMLSDRAKKAGIAGSLRRFWRKPYFLIIIGRRSSMTDESNRRRAEICNTMHNLQIITYDRLIDPFGSSMRWGPDDYSEQMHPLADFSTDELDFARKMNRHSRRDV